VLYASRIIFDYKSYYILTYFIKFSKSSANAEKNLFFSFSKEKNLKTYHIIYNFLKDFFHDRNYKNSFVIILLTYFAEVAN